MSTPILTTKLYVPPARPERVVRPRLVGQLDDGLRVGHRLILLSAPAGFGKTALLSDWLAQRQAAAAWLALDDHDNEPARFWSHLVAARRRSAPISGRTFSRRSRQASASRTHSCDV